MTLRIILLCIRHPRSWRQCVKDQVKAEPKVQEWRDQRAAAVSATRTTLREIRQPTYDPITEAVMGQQRTRQRKTKRSAS